jgi:transcriptional regulator
MYDYPDYKETDHAKIIEFMRAHPFVMLVGAKQNGRIEVTQVPVLISEENGQVILRGHIIRKSQHHKAMDENPSVIAIFSGPNTYVSATWYTTNPHMGSTWNYVSIHARGNIRWMDDEGLIDLMKELTLFFEKGNKNSSTIYENLPEEYTSRMIKGIIGFELRVSELENVHKLSQNRDEKSYDNVVVELKKQGGDAETISEWMKDRKDRVFNSSNEKGQ